MRKETYEHRPRKKKKKGKEEEEGNVQKKTHIKKKPKGPKHPECLCCGIFVQKQQGVEPPCFISYNLPNLGRSGFGEPEEKTLGSHQFSFLPPLPTKYPFQPFSLLSLSLSLSLSPKSSQPNHKRITEHFLLFSSHFLIFVTHLSQPNSFAPRSSQLR